MAHAASGAVTSAPSTSGLRTGAENGPSFAARSATPSGGAGTGSGGAGAPSGSTGTTSATAGAPTGGAQGTLRGGGEPAGAGKVAPLAPSTSSTASTQSPNSSGLGSAGQQSSGSVNLKGSGAGSGSGSGDKQPSGQDGRQGATSNTGQNGCAGAPGAQASCRNTGVTSSSSPGITIVGPGLTTVPVTPVVVPTPAPPSQPSSPSVPLTPPSPPTTSVHHHHSTPSGSGQGLISAPTIAGSTVASTGGIGGTVTGGSTTTGALSALLQPTLVPSPSARAAQTRAQAAVARQSQSTPQSTPAPSRPSVIQRIEKVVPLGVWIALVAALAFGALSTGWALMSGRRARRQAGRFAAVSEAALTDPLTGVLNRRGFTEATERELARARRYDRHFVLAYVDVRGLKRVNDSQGHLAGDKLLQATANLLRDSARADDVVGRIGGDELALLLVEQSAEGAAAVTGRIRQSVPARRAAMGLSAPWDLTIGIAAFPEDGDTFDDLLEAADRRLYEQRGIALH
jgi:diguanylate cyclase (GGDEF)-like protein